MSETSTVRRRVQNTTCNGRRALQWLATHNPFCAYGIHHDVEFYLLQPLHDYPIVLQQFRAYQEIIDSLPRGRCAPPAYVSAQTFFDACGALSKQLDLAPLRIKTSQS